MAAGDIAVDKAVEGRRPAAANAATGELRGDANHARVADCRREYHRGVRYERYCRTTAGDSHHDDHGGQLRGMSAANEAAAGRGGCSRDVCFKQERGGSRETSATNSRSARGRLLGAGRNEAAQMDMRDAVVDDTAQTIVGGAISADKAA